MTGMRFLWILERDKRCNLHALAMAILLLLAVPVAAEEEDPCLALIPRSLESALNEAFPKFRAPLTTDNLSQDVEWELKQGRQGCMGLAIGDFDGDAANDRLLALTPLHGSGGLVVVALARGDTWKFHRLSEWRGPRETLYVSTAQPGLYERTEGFDGPLEPGEVEALDCPRTVAIFGETASSGVAYCYNNGSWQHAWISD
jgi:hypothetical protein